MNSAFSIDLVICTYNNAELLKKTLEGIAQIKLPLHISCVLVVIIVPRIQHRWFRIKYKKTEIPIRMVMEAEQGLTSARVCGVCNTRSEWIAFIDDDCILATNWIEEAEKFIGTHAQCGLFGGRVQLLWEKKPPIVCDGFPICIRSKKPWRSAKRLKAVAGAGMIVKREALQKCRWIKEQF